ncbi:spore coat protein [uncultured Metabacillus sp.]|uniref:spore coat protein n=1 Tax=uncultured Metabacillus sp. TaxID=2860135 RepID=UPI00260766F3|nr:spore coat protein [uncultured Metabacillus sp.]
MEAKRYNWCALGTEDHPMKEKCHDERDVFGHRNDDAIFEQDGLQVANTEQEIKELIFIKDSCDIKVKSEQEQFAATINIGINLIISLLNIILDDDAELVTQELLQVAQTTQKSKQKVVIINCKDIEVNLEDQNTGVTLNLFLNIFVALLNIVLDLEEIV